jgi:hypothetical protein
MYVMPGRCPVCGEVLEVTRLHCRQCDTTIEGHYETSRIARLTADQLSFVETYLRCEGTIKRVEKELGISYPTVRARLEEVITAMGFEVVSTLAEQVGLSDADRAEVLNRLDRGEISSEEAVSLLKD